MHVHADYPPPKSWDQFEELCADVFQAAWADPALIRYGRSGQRQHGVDIVARSGALDPVGLQCKKRARWPVKTLTNKQIDAEVTEALKFAPALKAFYILTTAPDDVGLQDHARAISARHAAAGLFEVVVLGWGEIVRRATLIPAVADKHFGPSGQGARSPLLVSWMMKAGKLERSGRDLRLDIAELILDLQDWPDGHIVVRQRESDALLQILRGYHGRNLSPTQRQAQVDLRKQLRRLVDQEARAVRGVTMMLTDPALSDWLLKVWEPNDDALVAVEAYLNNEIAPPGKTPMNATQLRLTPPRAPHDRRSTLLSQQDVDEIQALMDWRTQTYGAPLTATVDELPPRVRAAVAVPRIVRDILEAIDEDRIAPQVLRQQGRYDLGAWTISLA